MSYTIDSIKITKTQADALVSSSSLIKGKTYEISNADTLFSDGAGNSVTLFLKAIDINKFSVSGIGKFYNPKYLPNTLDYNIWHNVARSTSSTIATGTLLPGELITANNGATATLISGFSFNKVYYRILSGDWSTATSITGNTSGATLPLTSNILPTYTVGTKRAWGGFMWQNVNGNVGTAPNIFTLNSEWTKLPYSETDYNVVYDEIEFDYTSGRITGRKDRFNNIVKTSSAVIDYFGSLSLQGTPINVFGWGNPLITNNRVEGGYLECINIMGKIKDNVVESYSAMYSNFMFTGFSYGTTYDNSMSGNIVNQYSKMFGNVLIEGSYMNENIISQQSTIYNNTSYNFCTNYANKVEDRSEIYNNQNRRSHIYENVLTGRSKIYSNRQNENSGGIIRNQVSDFSYINNNILSNNYTQAVASDQPWISGNILKSAYIQTNTLQVDFNGRRAYINNNTLIGDVDNDLPIRTSLINGNTVRSTISDTYLRSNNLKISQIFSMNIQGPTQSFIGNNLIDFVWDGASATQDGIVRGAELKLNTITATISKTFTGAANNGAIGTVLLPFVRIPAGYFISEALVNPVGLTGAGAVLNVGIETDNPTGILDNTSGDLATLTGVTRITPSTFIASTGNRKLSATVATAAITAGTVTIQVKLSKLS